MSYAAKILADSLNEATGDRLITFEVMFPRIILAEVNTHRALSKNSASSRAIPLEKQIERLLADTYIPLKWQKNQKGMQGGELLSESEQGAAVRIWLDARDAQIAYARALGSASGLNVHKQIVNRLIEPFMFHTAIISGTERENFYNLRVHPDAQPEFDKAAALMREAERASTPKILKPGEWHLPLFREIDSDDPSLEDPIVRAKVSAGRCGRVSYLTHDGVRDPAADVEMCNGKLIAPGHMSPLEHPAVALSPELRLVNVGNFTGFRQLRKLIPGEAIFRPRREA